MSQPFHSLPYSNFDFVRIQWTDLSNITHCRVVPSAYFKKLLCNARPGVPLPNVALGLVDLTTPPGFSASGEYMYALDLSTLRVCRHLPRTAVVVGWFERKSAGPIDDSFALLSVPICPRTTLKRIVDEAMSKLNVSFLVGFETEFILLTSTHPVTPVNSVGYSYSSHLLAGAKETEALEEMARALEAAHIEVFMYHSESAPGQYEIVTGPMPPLEAADALVHTREIIYNVAHKYGFKATLAPRIFNNSCGSGAHAHISVQSSSPSSKVHSDGDTTLSAHESSFLAGVLAHLRALIALTLPLHASYDRVADGVWSGGTYVCWGTENRETPVRLCHAALPRARNFELKCMDGTSNPHVALAGVLAAGMLGISEGVQLTIDDCAEKSAAQMLPEERAARGIVQRLPMSLEEARRCLREDEALCDVLGPEFVEAYLSVNEVRAARRFADDEHELEDLVNSY